MSVPSRHFGVSRSSSWTTGVSGPSRIAPPFKGQQQFRHADGLADVIIHADGEAFFSVPLHCARGEGDYMNWRLPRTGLRRVLLLFANQPRGLIAVHLGHLVVHEDQAVGNALQGLEHFETIRGSVNRAAHLGHQGEGDLLINNVVLGQQDARLSEPLMEFWRNRDRCRDALGSHANCGCVADDADEAVKQPGLLYRFCKCRLDSRTFGLFGRVRVPL